MAAVYVDNDLSAYSGKPRPEYRRLLAAIEAGEVGAVVAWHNDRLHRSPLELEEFIGVVEAAGCDVAMVEGGSYDLSTSAGRFSARVLGAHARMESEDKQRRLRRKHLELAEQGRPSGGGDTRPFGFEADQVTIREEEAELVREAAGWALEGVSLRQIAARWNERGVTTTSGRAWYPSAVRRILVGARWAGYREHKGRQYPAVWPAILARDTHVALRAVLLDPDRRNPGRPHGRLLSGIALCGKCGHTLGAQPRRGVPGYDCVKDRGGCGGTHIMADPVDALVRDWVAEQAAWWEVQGPPSGITSPNAAGPDPALVAELDALDARLERARGFLVDGTLTRDEYLRLRGETEARQEELRATVAEAMTGPSEWQRAVAGGLGAPTPADADQVWREELDEANARWLEVWDGLDLDERRVVVRQYLDRVLIGPAVRGRNRFDPGRVTIEPA